MVFFNKKVSTGKGGIVVASKKKVKYSFFKKFTFNIWLSIFFIIILFLTSWLYYEKEKNKIKYNVQKIEILKINEKISNVKKIFDKINGIDTLKIKKENIVKNMKFLKTINIENYTYKYNKKEKSFLIPIKGVTLAKINEILKSGIEAKVINVNKSNSSLSNNSDGTFNFDLYFK